VTYNCKYQLNSKHRKYIPKEECKNCLADVIHNHFCDKYSSITLEDFFNVRRFTAVDNLEVKI
jgi:hypothetical protein